jgi:hypothetical protein
MRQGVACFADTIGAKESLNSAGLSKKLFRAGSLTKKLSCTHHVADQHHKVARPPARHNSLPNKGCPFGAPKTHTSAAGSLQPAAAHTPRPPPTCVRRASSPGPRTRRWSRASASALARRPATSPCASSPTVKPASRSVSRLARAHRSSLPC